jgi:hypothetical protein
MLPMWTKIQTLLDGTDSMRAAGTEYLPQHPEESDDAYSERLAKATLLNMLKMTLDSWVGKPFSAPIKFGDDIPKELIDLTANIDLQGNDLNVFGRNWFRDGVGKAFSHVLVEFPRPQPRADGQPRTLEDDRRDKLRPYWVHIRPENVLFASREFRNGVEHVTSVRILEHHTTLQGFEEVTVCRIREITPGYVKIYEEIKDKKTKKVVWKVVDEYPYDLPYIPLVTFYADREDFMRGTPPLNDLADLNVSHWQGRADQTSVLTVARFPILAVSGAVTDDKMVVGPNAWLHCPDAAGRFYYVEHSGKAINAGRTDLMDLEETMAEYGATFLKKRPGGASATARALDTAETTSPLQDMAIRFQSALARAMQFTADWLKIKAEVGTWSVNLDFGIDASDAPHLTSLSEARKNKDISRTRYTKELQRMGVLDEDYDSEADLKLLDAEAAKALVEQKAQLELQASMAPKPAPGAPGDPPQPGPKPPVEKKSE